MDEKLPFWTNSDAIAFVDDVEEFDPEYLKLFDDSELSIWHQIKYPLQQRNWISSRLMAKYLCLSRVGRIGTRARELNIEKFTLEKLNQYPSWAFKDLNLDHSSPSSRIIFTNQSNRFNYSVSNKNGKVSLCLSREQQIGIDLEEVVERRALFYRYNFTEREKNWVARLVTEADFQPDLLFTLLWTIKEAYFKSGQSNCKTVLDFPGIEVRLKEHLYDNGLLGFGYQNRHLENFKKMSFIPAIIHESDQKAKVQIAISTNQNMVMTALKI